MNPIVELLKQSQGTLFVSEDGIEDRFELKPALTEQELATFEGSLPCPIPEEVREVLRFARGFDGVLGGISFAGLPAGFGLEQIFPHAVALAGDGFGNLVRLPRCGSRRFPNRQPLAFSSGSHSVRQQAMEKRN
jgi:hypothetical protein